MTSPPPAAQARVLVVDDEQPLARLVGTYLERGGFDVVAINGDRDHDALRGW